MKICCDLCRGTLQMNAGGQDATCLNCGMTYTMERLRRMLNPPQDSVVQPPVAPAVTMPVPAPVAPLGVTGGATPQNNRITVPQFIMHITSAKGDKITGTVQQGGVGIGDTVFINNDYAHPYQVQGDENGCPVKQGNTVLFMLDNVPSYIMKNARIVTGVSNPVESAYNYPSSGPLAVLSYMENLLQREFADYKIENNVPCAGVSKPVTFLLSKDGRPVVAVYIIDLYNEKERYAVKKAARVLAPYGIGVTHFIETYRNDAPYVVERIRSAMK